MISQSELDHDMEHFRPVEGPATVGCRACQWRVAYGMDRDDHKARSLFMQHVVATPGKEAA
jgi:hypothetical protein